MIRLTIPKGEYAEQLIAAHNRPGEPFSQNHKTAASEVKKVLEDSGVKTRVYIGRIGVLGSEMKRLYARTAEGLIVDVATYFDDAAEYFRSHASGFLGLNSYHAAVAEHQLGDGFILGLDEEQLSKMGIVYRGEPYNGQELWRNN